MRCTKVDFPAPAIPIVIITTGSFFSGILDEEESIMNDTR